MLKKYKKYLVCYKSILPTSTIFGDSVFYMSKGILNIKEARKHISNQVKELSDNAENVVITNIIYLGKCKKNFEE